MLLMTKKYQHLSPGQRYQLEALKNNCCSQSEIALAIGVNKSTVSREIRRNSVQSVKSPDKYKAKQAQLFAAKRAFKPPCIKSCCPKIQLLITSLLEADWSPEQISVTCANNGVEMLSTEGIYKWVYAQPRHETDLTSCLRRHHRVKRKRRLTNQPRVIIKDKVTIHERPPEVDKQERFGDMETDLVKCKNGYLLTITERKSLFNIIVKLPNKEALTIQNAMILTLLPFMSSIKTITSDNGTEFAFHKDISDALDIKWYFADTYSPQQRGCNENQNGLIRQYFKRDTDLNLLTQDDINKVQKRLNDRPRKKNNFVSPSKLLNLHLVALAA